MNRYTLVGISSVTSIFLLLAILGASYAPDLLGRWFDSLQTSQALLYRCALVVIMVVEAVAAWVAFRRQQDP
jgi:Kef-type K+ transport system membrane component KefB